MARHISLLLAVSTVAAAEHPNRSCTFNADQSGHGNQLGPALSGVVSKEACCAICANTSGCAGWTWDDTVVHGD